MDNKRLIVVECSDCRPAAYDYILGCVHLPDIRTEKRSQGIRVPTALEARRRLSYILHRSGYSEATERDDAGGKAITVNLGSAKLLAAAIF